MNNAIAIASIAVLMAFMGLVAVSLDIGGMSRIIPDVPDVAEPSGGLLDGILRALLYAFQAIGSLIALLFAPLFILTAEEVGMPGELAIILPLSVGFFMFYIIVRLIRGGG